MDQYEFQDQNHHQQTNQNHHANNFDEKQENHQNRKTNQEIKLPHFNQKSQTNLKHPEINQQSEENNAYQDQYEEQTPQITQKQQLSNSKSNQTKIISQNPKNSPRKQKKISQKTESVKQQNTKNSANFNISRAKSKNRQRSFAQDGNQESKYLQYLKAQFYHSREQVQKFVPEKLTKLNQRLKDYIKRVNDELTDMINDSLRKLKAENNSKNQAKTVEDELKVMKEHKQSRCVYLETLEKQNKQLSLKYNLLKQKQNSESQSILDEEIRQIQLNIKQTSKQIHDLRLTAHNGGNKLAEENNIKQKVNDVKSKLANAKKQQEKINQRFAKTQFNLEQLTLKTSQIDSQLAKYIEQAKNKNLQIDISFSNSQKKAQRQKLIQTKKRHQFAKNHKEKSTSLIETKLNILKRDNQIIKAQLAEKEQKQKELEEKVLIAQENSKNLIIQGKNQQLQPHIEAHLDFILKNIEEGTLNIHNYNHMQLSRVSREKSKNKEDLKQYPSTGGSVSKVSRSYSHSDLKPSFNIVKKNPVINLKEKNVLKITEKTSNKRYWKENSTEQPVESLNRQKSISMHSKPFLVKKSAPLVHQSEEQKATVDQAQKVNQTEKQNEKNKTILGPKMINFKKRNSQMNQIKQDEEHSKVITQKNINEMVQPNQAMQSSKPKFNIKRSKKQKNQASESQQGQISNRNIEEIQPN